MRTQPGPSAAGTRIETRLTALLCALGAWTLVVPYVGHAIGLGVNVASRVEIVDHVVPGALVSVIAGGLLLLARRKPAVDGWATLLGGGVCFLAGFWVLATHVPLLFDAARGQARWGAALWHASTALPIVLISLWYALRGAGLVGEEGGQSSDATPRKAARRG